MKLSILIATTVERKDLFIQLLLNFHKQLQDKNLISKVEVLFDETGKEMSIGEKRQKLLERASGEYIVFFDDDDEPIGTYIETIVTALEQNPGIDCLGFKIKMTTNGQNIQMCEHSLKHKEWKTVNQSNLTYLRNVTHFNPVKRELALQAGFPNLRFGEDKVYSDKVSKLCRKEYYLDIPYLFHYRYSNKVAHNEKYGINNDSK